MIVGQAIVTVLLEGLLIYNKHKRNTTRNPQSQCRKRLLEWWSGIRGFYAYCLGDVVVRYDPEQKLWYYECLNNKLQHIEWQDTKRGRRVYEHVEDQNGKTLRHYDAHDPKMVMCWGYGCPPK
jgi:hypothetical protein